MAIVISAVGNASSARDENRALEALPWPPRLHPDWRSPSPRLCRLVEHWHGLGPRAGLEFMREIAVEYGIDLAEIERRLEAYAKLDPDMVAGLGGDIIPRPPLTLVPPTIPPTTDPLDRIVEPVPLAMRDRDAEEMEDA